MSRIMNLIYVRYVIDVVVGVVKDNNDDDVHCESDNRLLPQLSSRSLTSHNSSNNNNRFMIFLFAIHYLLFLVLINLGLLIYWKIIWKMTTNPVFYGSLTKEWYDIWRKSSLPVVGAATTTTSATTTTEVIDRPLTFEAAATDRLTISQIRLLFHNLEIFPTESQIYEMIQCASRCSGSATISTAAKINENSNQQNKYNTNDKECLTFGEFCYFASILQNSYQQQQNSSFPTPNPLNASNTFYDKLDRIQQFNASRCDTIDDDNASFEVFLGGSCNPTRWRTELVIPELKKHGITYYNPQVDHWGPDLIELENYAKQNSEVLFFVIDNQTRAIASMIEVAFIASSERKLILSIDNLEWPNCKLTDGNMSIEEYNSLNKGRAYLRDVVERQGIPIFSEIPQALKSAIRVIKEQINPRDLTHQTDKIMPIRMGHISVADKMIQMFKVFELFKNDCKEFTFADLALAYRSLSNGKILSPKLIQQLALCHSRNSSKNDDCFVDDHSGDGSDESSSNCDCRRNIIANNLDKIVINFDQFCCIMTELNHLQDEATEAEQSSTKRSIRQTQHQHDPLWIRSVKHFPAYLLERIAKFYHLLMSIIDETFSRKDELNNDDGVVNHHHHNQYQQQPTSHSSRHLQNPYSNVVRRHSYRRRLSSAYSHSSHHHHMAAPSPHQSSSVRYSYQTPSTPSAGYQSASSQSRRHSFTQSRSVATTTTSGVHHHYHHYLSPPTQLSYNSSGQSTPSPMVGSNGGGRLSTSGSRHHGGSHFNHHLNQAESSSSITSLLYDTSLIDLFIGGEVDSKYMADSIIPLLKKNLITYCTPMLDAWTSQRMIPLQAKKYEICRCLLFIITKDTLDISFMILAAHYVGLGYNVVLCIQYMDLDDPKLLSKISVDAIKDYNRGRSYLSDLATKSGVRVFSDISEAIECSIDICSSSSNICDSTPNGTNWD